MTTDNEFDFDAIIDKAKASFNRHLSVIKGQQMTELDDPEWHIANEAWQAATAVSDKRIAELKAKVSELDGMLGSRNLHKEHEYLQRMSELQAHINDLRETLEWIDRDYGTIGIHSIVTSSLSKTPAQSLQEHYNKVIEKCAVAMENYHVLEGIPAMYIRALKG